jgi:pimeloyl-ACP methyl ester carboxylesterase
MIHGGDDWMVPPADAEQLRAALTTTHTTLIVIPRAEHDTTHQTAHAMYEAAVLAFLERTLVTGAARNGRG